MMDQMMPKQKIRTSKIELIDITKAWLTLSFAFALVYSGISLMGGKPLTQVLTLPFLLTFAIALFTAGIGFLLHELAHKFTAQHFGCLAEFRAFNQMLFLAVFLAAVTGFIFAAPGAVMISGMITRKENGIISLAGPMMNYVLALLFLGLHFLFPTLAIVFLTGFFINAWLGTFNLIPFGNFDGFKIFHWSKAVWGAMLAVGIFLIFFLPQL